MCCWIAGQAQNDWFLGTIYQQSLPDSTVILHTNSKGILTEKLLPINAQYNVPYKSILVSNRNNAAAFFSSYYRTSSVYSSLVGLKNLNNSSQIDTTFLSSEGISAESYCAKIKNPLADSIYLLISKKATIYKPSISLRVDSITFKNNVQLHKKSFHVLYTDSLINRGRFINSSITYRWGATSSNELGPFGTIHSLEDWSYACDPHSFNLISTNKSKIYSYRYDNNRGELLKIDSLEVNPPIKGIKPKGYPNHYEHYSNREIIKLKLS